MSSVFVIRNQNGHYLGKQQQWLDGRDRRLLYRTPHRDEAVNVVFELSSKDIYLRAEPLLCELDNSHPVVEAGPPLLLEQAAPEQAVLEHAAPDQVELEPAALESEGLAPEELDQHQPYSPDSADKQ